MSKINEIIQNNLGEINETALYMSEDFMRHRDKDSTLLELTDLIEYMNNVKSLLEKHTTVKMTQN